MKLYTKIAGTLALPLALAVAANSAQAYTVVDTSEHKLAVGGFLAAIASWDKQGDKKSAVNNKFNSNFSAGTSRLNIAYTNKEIGTLFFYEQQFTGGAGAEGQTNGLRHAYFKTEDGWIGGHTWSFGTNLVALAETIDITGNSLVSYQVRGPRNLLLGKKFKLDDSMSVGVAIEGKNAANNDSAAQVSKAPSVSVNFEGDFSGVKVFAALTNYAANKRDHDSGYRPAAVGRNDATQKQSGKDKRYNRVTLGTAIPMGDATLKLGLTHNRGMTSKNLYDSKTGQTNTYGADTAKGTHASAALTYRFTEKVRANVAGEYSKWDKHAYAKSFDPNANANYNQGKSAGTGKRFWVNAFYQADNGIEWGAELQRVSLKASQRQMGVVGARDTSAKYGTEQGGAWLADKGTVVRVQAKYAF